MYFTMIRNYEISDFISETGETINHKSYSIPDDMLEEGQIRLLDTDTSIVVSVDIHVWFVTANDCTPNLLFLHYVLKLMLHLAV